MGSVNSAQASYITTAVAHDAVFLVGVALAAIIGFFRPKKYTDYTFAMIRRLRYIMLVISFSALVYSAGFWFLYSGTGTYTRGGVNDITEWLGWASRGVLFVGVTWAIAEALFMKLSASLLITALMFFTELDMVVVNFLTTNAQKAIVTAFFCFGLISVWVLLYAWQHVNRSFIFMHLWVPSVFTFLIAADGLWAFLSNNFWDAMGFNDNVENWLFAAFDIAFTVSSFILISIMYVRSAPSKDAAVYNQYVMSLSEKKTDNPPTSGGYFKGV